MHSVYLSTHSTSSIREDVDDVVVVVVVVVVPLAVFNNVGKRRAAARFDALVTPIDGDTDIRPDDDVDLSILFNAADAGAITHKTGKIPTIALRNFILFPLLVSIHYIIENGEKKEKSVSG